MTFTQTSRTFAVAALMLMAACLPAAADAPARPARRVVATYFHRTVRCPTCQRVGSALEAAIRANFAAELNDGRLEWRMMDFQDPRNAGFAAAFGITGPAFIIMEVQGDRVVAWKPAPKAWSLLGDQDAFSRYVQAEVRSVLGVDSSSAR